MTFATLQTRPDTLCPLSMKDSANSLACHSLVSGTDQSFKCFAKLLGLKIHISLITLWLLFRDKLSIFVYG